MSSSEPSESPDPSRTSARAAYGLIAFAVVASVIGWLIGGRALGVASASVLVVATVSAVVSLIRNRPAPTAGWWCLAGGATLWGVGNLFWVGHSSLVAITAVDTLSLVAFLPLTGSQLLIAHARGREHTDDGMIDGMILGLVGVLLAWVLVVAPEVHGADTIERLVITLRPLLDGLVLVGVVWIALLPGTRCRSLVLLGSGYAVALVADAWFYIGWRVDGTWTSRIDGLYAVAVALLFAAILHPSSRDVSVRPSTIDRDRVHPGRLLLLALAMFVGPVAAMSADGEFSTQDVIVTLCCLVIVGLVFVRFIGLVRDNEKTQRRFRLLAENVPVGIYEVSKDLEISFANAAADRLFGTSVQDRLAPDLLALVHPDDRARMVDAAEAVLGGLPAEVAFRLRRSDGSMSWVQWRGTPVESRGRGLPTALASTLDITALKDAQAALLRQATYDPLTQLPNRRLFTDRLHQALVRRDRHLGTLALMFCDLDGFKTVNDVHGHEAGDAILIEIGRRLCRTVRATDSVARIGGDEFVVLCEEAGTRDDLARLAESVVQAVNQPWRFQNSALTVGVSVGIAVATIGDDGNTLLRRADDAMYLAKAGGRNRFEFAPDDTGSDDVGRTDRGLPEVARLHHVREADW